MEDGKNMLLFGASVRASDCALGRTLDECRNGVKRVYFGRVASCRRCFAGVRATTRLQDVQQFI